ncbi:MAG: hypothetical protein ACTSRP_14500 [Candidatus Helarchaeota archaeon]
MISGHILVSALLDIYDAEIIHNFMYAVFQKFNAPNYMVGNSERGIIAAMRKYYSNIPYQYNHSYFLTNMGKDLMEGFFRALKKTKTKRRTKTSKDVKTSIHRAV